MSKLGYIQNIYGKNINIAIANTYSYNVLNGSNLPASTLIVSSNVDANGEDTGSYSLIATDYIGNPVRLTYSIEEGNGLYYSQDDDALSMHIDNNTIVNTDNGLAFDVAYVLSDDFVINGYDIFVNTNNIPNTSSYNYGIASIDDNTIKSNDGELYVATENLNYSNNLTNQYGIGIGDAKTVFTKNGYIYADIDSFDKATNDTFGLVRGSNMIEIHDGIMSVKTENLSTATSDQFGISKADNKTIIYDASNALTVNEDNLETATASTYGISKIDNKSLSISKTGNISMVGYKKINDYISEKLDKINEYSSKLKEYNDYLASGDVLYQGNTIELFTVNRTSVAELDKPKEDEEVTKMPLQTISVELDIVTTCDFKLNIEFKEGTNISPAISLNEVNYNDEKIYTRDEALNPNTIYASTNGHKKRLTIKFKGKNYRNSISIYEYAVTGITFTAMNAKDVLKYKSEKYSIIRYNSYYLKLLREQEEKEKREGNKFYVLDLKNTFWRKL